MALSGSATTRVGSYWYLDLSWTATQNHDDNTSTVTAKLYWRSESPYSTSSSATKDGSITLGGLTSSFSGAGLAGLSAGQSKLIHTYKRTIEHSSTGTLAIAINAVFNPEITLSGTYYGSVSVSDGTQTLNTIPRESKLNDTTPNWTAGSDLTLSFTRYSSSFNHKLDIYLQDSAGTSTMPSGATGWTGLKATHLKLITYSTSQTSLSSSFSTDEKYEIFQRLAGGSSTKAWFRLTTYSGTTRIGDPVDYFSTVTAPSASTTAVGNFTLGNTVSIPITRSDSEFKHEVKVAVGSWSKVLDTDATTSYSWTSSTDKASILPQISSTSTTGTATFTITTYFFHSNGTSKQIVKTATIDTATVTIPSTESPTFTGAVTWADTASITLNGVTTSMNTLKGTGNDLVMVQSKSKLVVTLPSTALGTAKAGTTMKQYTVTINGVTRTVAHPATATNLTFTFVESELNVATNQTMVVKAYDNRNLSTSINKTVTFVPYSVPVVTGKAIRNNGFDNPSTIGASGSISPVSINSVNKNSVATIQYQYKIKGASDATYTTLALLTIGTATFPAYKSNDKTDLSLDNTQSFTVKMIVTDKFGQNSITKDIATGVPIMFMDSVKKSIGVGVLPKGTKTFEVGGELIAGKISLTNGTKTQTVMTWSEGDDTGDGVIIGHRGRVVVSAGESGQVFADNDSSTGSAESAYIVADNNIWIMSNMQTSFGERFSWSFRNDGVINMPHASSVYIDQYGNIKSWAGTTTATWNVIDSNGRARISVPMGASSAETTPVKIGQFEFVSGLGVAGDEESRSAIVFRSYTSTNKEYIVCAEDTNGFYFNADQALPPAGGRGTGNGELFAAKFNVVSDREQKENIVEYEESALAKVKGSKTYKYDHKMSSMRRNRLDQNGIEVKQALGLVAQEAPTEITTNEGTGIDLYAMNTMLWKAVQELAEQVEYLEKKQKRK